MKIIYRHKPKIKTTEMWIEYGGKRGGEQVITTVVNKRMLFFIWSIAARERGGPMLFTHTRAHTQRERQRHRERISKLTGALSTVNHKGLYQGWGRLSSRHVYIVERTNKAEIGQEEQCDKTESCRKNLWNEIQLKGPQRQRVWLVSVDPTLPRNGSIDTTCCCCCCYSFWC